MAPEVRLVETCPSRRQAICPSLLRAGWFIAVHDDRQQFFGGATCRLVLPHYRLAWTSVSQITL